MRIDLSPDETKRLFLYGTISFARRTGGFGSASETIVLHCDTRDLAAQLQLDVDDGPNDYDEAMVPDDSRSLLGSDDLLRPPPVADVGGGEKLSQATPGDTAVPGTLSDHLFDEDVRAAIDGSLLDELGYQRVADVAEVLGAELGFDAAESKAWFAVKAGAREMMSLESLHPMQDEEYAHMWHRIQRALLSRPAHRKLIASGEGTQP